jgi:hypothetical protein
MKCVGLLFVLMLTVVAGVRADVPWPNNSTIDLEVYGPVPCFPQIASACPAGDMGNIVVIVTVRNEAGDPIAGMAVECWVSQPSETFCFCFGEDPQTGITDGEGVVQFVYDNFGGCGYITFEAEAVGVPLGSSGSVFVASVDFDGTRGDCRVGLSDFAYFSYCFNGPYNRCVDYDCDGSVGLADFARFSAHFGHACP